jgi:lysozyme
MPPRINRPLNAGRASRVKRSAAIAGLAVALVGGFEGLRTAAYIDPVGIPTICFGETRGVRMGDAATKSQCEGMLIDRLDEFSAGIDKCLPRDLPPRTYVAFLSAAYNIGVPAFCGSSMARKSTVGDLIGACDALLLWNRVTMGGVRVALPGLSNRRKEERDLCLAGITKTDT